MECCSFLYAILLTTIKRDVKQARFISKRQHQAASSDSRMNVKQRLELSTKCFSCLNVSFDLLSVAKALRFAQIAGGSAARFDIYTQTMKLMLLLTYFINFTLNRDGRCV